MRRPVSELVLGALALAGAIGIAVGGGFAGESYVSSLCASVASTLLGVAIALTLVHFYLQRKSRREAVESLLQLVLPSIRDHHNTLLKHAHLAMGKVQFEKVVDTYWDHNGDPVALSPEQRNAIYTIITGNWADYEKIFLKLEAVTVLGWSFDPYILDHAFQCRYAIAKLRALTLDDDEQTKLDACEQFLDADTHAATVFARLVKTLGLSDSDVYEDRMDYK